MYVSVRNVDRVETQVCRDDSSDSVFPLCPGVDGLVLQFDVSYRHRQEPHFVDVPAPKSPMTG